MTADPYADLTQGLVETVKALASGERQPAVPRHAATVLLLRDGAGGLEVYMLRRTASMAFAAGFFVFPGGSVDPRDEELPDAAWVGPPPSVWGASFGADDGLARLLVCAAVRETFEESGVLLAGAGPDDVVSDTSGDDWEADRLALLDRSLSLSGLLARRGLVLRADLLRPWAHWITPEVEPKRFDTRFFLAAMPGAQRTRDVGGEADRVAWLRPRDALAGSERGEMSMLPPTLASLTALAGHAGVASALAAAPEQRIRPVLPKLLLGPDDQLRFLMPGDPDYPADPAEVAG